MNNQKNILKNLKSPAFQNGYIFLLIFIVFFNFQQSTAQPASVVPMNGNNGKGTGSSESTDNSSNDQERGDDVLQYKKMLIMEEQEASNGMNEKIIVNYDSLYNYFAANNALLNNNGSKVIVKYIPNKNLSRLYEFDSTSYKLIMPNNKYYATLIVKEENMTKKLNAFIERIDETNKNVHFKTYDVLNGILPPLVLVNGYDIKPKDYEAFLSEFFSRNPDLIYFCSKSYIKILERKQYNKLLKMHRGSENVLDYKAKQDVKG
jgi:hypothetical protein